MRFVTTYFENQSHSKMVMPRHMAMKEPISNIIRNKSNYSKSCIWNGNVVFQRRINEILFNASIGVQSFNIIFGDEILSIGSWTDVIWSSAVSFHGHYIKTVTMEMKRVSDVVSVAFVNENQLYKISKVDFQDMSALTKFPFCKSFMESKVLFVEYTENLPLQSLVSKVSSLQV